MLDSKPVEAEWSPIQEATLAKPTWVRVPITKDAQGGPHPYPMLAGDLDDSLVARMSYAWLAVVFVNWKGQICLIVLLFVIRFALLEVHLRKTQAPITYKPDFTVGFIRGKFALLQTLADWQMWKAAREAEREAARKKSARPERVKAARTSWDRFGRCA